LIGLPETSLAIIPGAGGTQRLPRLIGASKAKELIFTGDRLQGEEALKLGIVNHVEDDFDKAYKKALEIANKISEKGPIAIKAAK
jgi:enoyl-CoA hydratase/carnithine racemase